MNQTYQLSRALLSVLIIVPVGFYCKFYNGPAENWVNNSLGGVFYVIFWCLVLSLFLRKTEPWRIAIVVLTITCFLEFLQLWHHQFLEFIRSYFIGKTILGTSFTWYDFPYYFVGCGIGWLWMTCLRKLDKNKIPFINRIIYNIWKKHWEIIVAIVLALFVSLVIMPRFLK